MANRGSVFAALRRAIAAARKQGASEAASRGHLPGYGSLRLDAPVDASIDDLRGPREVVDAEAARIEAGSGCPSCPYGHDPAMSEHKLSCPERGRVVLTMQKDVPDAR